MSPATDPPPLSCFLLVVDHAEGGWELKETSRAQLARRCRAQFGVISRDQALECVGRRTIDGLTAGGELAIMRKGVYRLAAVPPSWEQDLMAAQFACGRGAAVCGQAAAALWKLDGAKRILEIAVERPRRLHGVRVRCLQLDPVEVRRRGPFRVTSIERTLLDFAATSAADNLETALDSALNRGLTAIPRLRNYIDRRAERGRRGMAMLREMVTIRDPRCAPNQSPLETKLARLLRESMLPTPCPQFVVTSTKGFVAKLDFAYPDLRLAIEALGWEYHGGRLRWKRDLNRLNQLTNLGWRTLLFTWSDVVAAPARTLDTLNGAYSSPFF